MRPFSMAWAPNETFRTAKKKRQTTEASARRKACFLHLSIATRERISEKNAAFELESIIAGRAHDVRCNTSGDSRHYRGRHGIPAGVLDRSSVACGTLLRSRR